MTAFGIEVHHNPVIMPPDRIRGAGSHKLRGHAAPKPTVDEVLASQSRPNKVSTEFLKVDLETGLTFANLALQADDNAKKERNRRAARKAYDTIVRLIDRVILTDAETKFFKKNLQRLKDDLIKLGEAL